MSEEMTEKKEENAKAWETVHEGAEVPKPDKDVEENRVVAVLSYLGPLFFVPLFLKRESPFCQFHAKQGLAFFVVWMIGWAIFWVPVFGWLLWVAVALFDVYAIVKAFQGEKWEAPIIGDLAKKINI